jgi:hypothetical protein
MASVIRYAVSREGVPLPFELHEEDVRAKHPYEVLTLRGMIAVPYFEKALYEPRVPLRTSECG